MVGVLTPRRAASVLLLLAALVGCGDEPVTTGARPSPAVPGLSPSASPVPSPAPSPPRPSPAAASASPSVARVVPAAQGDVDGDGSPDEIAYQGVEAVVVLSGGSTVRASTAADIDGEEPVTAGVEDLDRDGRAEVFVQVGQGASTGFLLVLRYDGRTLAPLTVDGAPRLLAYGGSATHGDGFACAPDGSLVVRSATSEDGEAYALETVTYRVQGRALVETGRDSGTAQGMDDPAVGAAYVMDCRSVGEGV